ncbi:PcfJ domain-containing protein [Pasteurellaceae bacterium LIM206]|nr:PcfJ domain-containing protein [Pasteurellaceae bacterium LIM206]
MAVAVFFDKSLISLVARIRPNSCGLISLAECAYYQRHLRALNKIAAQYPNLLPLTRYISPEHWHDPDLFSFAYWTSQNENGVSHINTLTLPGVKFAMLQKSHWRWLKKQSSQFVVKWCEQDLDLLVNLERAVSYIPVCVKKTILYLNTLFQVFHPHQNEILLLFVRYVINYKKEHDIQALRRYLKRAESALCDLTDYWRAERHPGVPKSWERLTERGERWHRELLIQQRQRADKGFQKQLNAGWESPVLTHQIENVTFTALNTGLALFDEGQRMHHCIFSYVSRCVDKKYLVFSVTETLKDGSLESSTLGLYRFRNKWRIEQHRKIYNGDVSEYLSKISQRFCQLLNEKMK